MWKISHVYHLQNYFPGVSPWVFHINVSLPSVSHPNNLLIFHHNPSSPHPHPMSPGPDPTLVLEPKVHGGEIRVCVYIYIYTYVCKVPKCLSTTSSIIGLHQKKMQGPESFFSRFGVLSCARYA